MGLIVGTPLVVGAAVGVGGPAILALGALVVLAVGTYVGLRHPRWLFTGLAVVLGALPFGALPGLPLPLAFGLGAAVGLAALLHPTAVRTVRPLEVAVALLVLTSMISVLLTGRTTTDAAEFVKWIVATGLVFALLRLPRPELMHFGRVFVWSSAVAATWAMVIVAIDPEGRLMRLLRPFGYGLEEVTTRYVYTDEGRSVRLAGTWIDPNSAGIGLVVALLVCAFVMRGRTRVALAAVLLVALALTLSRAGLFSIVGGTLLVLVFHALRPRHRRALVGTLAAGCVAALAVPQVRARILNSFGSDDTGSTAREDALSNFPHQLAGHWWQGLGWGREEFVDGEVGFVVNHVANAPLLTVYRGGLLAGLAFVGVIVIGCVISYRALRGRDLGRAVYGGCFIGFCAVALQLDFPVVTIPSVTMMFSVLLAFTAVLDESDAPSGGLDRGPRGSRTAVRT